MPSSGKQSQPSDSEIKEFWEWCGLQVRVVNYENDSWVEWLDPKDIFISRVAPTIDLNNLLKYAVPKVDIDRMYEILLEWAYTVAYLEKQDSILALFWAIKAVQSSSSTKNI